MKTKDLFNFIIIVWALALPTTLWADDYDDFKPYTENDITYIIYEDEHGEKYAETFAYGRLKGDFVIPAYITKDSIPVKILAGSYEWAMEDLRSLTIPATVEKIDPIRVTPQSYMAPQFHDFYVDADNPYYESCEGLLFTKDGVLIGWPYTNGMDSETITVPEGTIGIEASVMFQIDTCDPKVLVFPSTLEAVDRDLPVDDYDLTVICRATTPPRLNNCNPILILNIESQN